MSIIAWDFRIQRPQHLSRSFAQAGHRVFYVEMEFDAGEGTAREVTPGVHVVSLPSRRLGFVRPYTGVASGSQARAWVAAFYSFCDSVAVSPHSHVVIEHPYWWQFVRHLGPQFRLAYDCMDDISGFPDAEPHVRDAEVSMIDSVDTLIVSSTYLLEKHGKSREAFLVRNGTDVDHFLQEERPNMPAFLAGKLASGSIRVGYVGAIAEWFDVELLEEVARRGSDLDIHLCGAITDSRAMVLDGLANVTLHGEIDYRDVPGFLREMDVLIIPFRLTPLILACDPVKFYEYSATMRPTVAAKLPELDRAGDLVFTGTSASDFLQQIPRAHELGRDPDYQRALRQYALENTWQDRATSILEALRNEPLVSVVILAYGQARLTINALASVVRDGAWPNLEVIVVDNGSPEGELAELRAATDDDPRVRLIENGENLGFAKGNNIGIQAARGDFVLLLNNDTYVASGAIGALVKHLQRSPSLGVVGPMTDNIGNEARVSVRDFRQENIDQIARDLSTGYRAKWTPMRVCAYFCVMFRRSDLFTVGLLPEVYSRGTFEDDDHCAMFKHAGFEIGLAEDAFVHHDHSATFLQVDKAERDALFARNRAIFETRWGPWTPHRLRDQRPPASLDWGRGAGSTASARSPANPDRGRQA